MRGANERKYKIAGLLSETYQKEEGRRKKEEGRRKNVNLASF
ncbi:MAG: hypothetical protein ACRC62_19395 [Microcoleus sp.]